MIAFWVDGIGVGQTPSLFLGKDYFHRVNATLKGQVVDFTQNHGRDNRIWSPALGKKRDMYVYLPPNFDPNVKYPFTLFLHGAGQDEMFFIQAQVFNIDKAICDGILPPCIVVAPDGSLHGRPSYSEPATFWANSDAGRFEDYVMCDVWDFAMSTFPIRPEREAHAIVGASMGGSASFALAIKHRDRVKAAVGFFPLLNLRYVDCKDRYRTKFNPECFKFRTKWHGKEALGRRRFVVLTFDKLFKPMFGRGQRAIDGISSINPLELMEMTDLKPGELDLYVAYGGMDEFNVAAQVESFLHVAQQRGINVTVDYDPKGRHNLATGQKMVPAAFQWVSQRVIAHNDRYRGSTIFTSQPRHRK